MVTSEESIKNLHDTKLQVTLEDTGTINSKKRGNWHGYQKPHGKLHCMK